MFGAFFLCGIAVPLPPTTLQVWAPFETQLCDACWVTWLPNINTFGIINIVFVVVVVFIESIKNGKEDSLSKSTT